MAGARDRARDGRARLGEIGDSPRSGRPRSWAACGGARPCGRRVARDRRPPWTSCTRRPKSTSGRSPRRWSSGAGTMAGARVGDGPAPRRNPRRGPRPSAAGASRKPQRSIGCGRLAAMEARADLLALLDGARPHELPWLLDDEVLTLGQGLATSPIPWTRCRPAADVRWPAISEVPTAVVTGSNGKTTTVRLIAACARAHGWRTGYNCTDGLFLDGTQITSGDYSGPVGARSVLRDRRVQAAVLETARGGLLRRGLALNHAHVAVVTNVSSDHFGEYGIHDLAALADVKLVLANLLDEDGLLVVNADDGAAARARRRHRSRCRLVCPGRGRSAACGAPCAWRRHRRRARGSARGRAPRRGGRPGRCRIDAAHGRRQRRLQHRQPRRCHACGPRARYRILDGRDRARALRW